MHSHGISFVCPSLLSRNSHKLEFDARHDAAESLRPTPTESRQFKKKVIITINVGKSRVTGISYIINNSKNLPVLITCTPERRYAL